jgi:NAD(P)-dependent dehydrogenase (short-subunit alcohol dehydrogenase family)
MNIELKGRKAIITGSTAEGLARAGASVIINGRGRPTGLEEIGPRTSRTAIGRVEPPADVGVARWLVTTPFCRWPPSAIRQGKEWTFRMKHSGG